MIVDKLENIDRAARISAAVSAYRAYTGGEEGSPEENAIDLLIDIQHYCALHNICFDSSLSTSINHFFDEAEGGELL